jgi:hypothetical protein
MLLLYNLISVWVTHLAKLVLQVYNNKFKRTAFPSPTNIQFIK